MNYNLICSIEIWINYDIIMKKNAPTFGEQILVFYSIGKFNSLISP